MAEAFMPSLVCLSPNGWMNIYIFAEWFHHYTEHIPSRSPAVLFTDTC